MLPEQLCLADRGYQGIAKLHSSSCTPTKKRRHETLDPFEREHNRSARSIAGCRGTYQPPIEDLSHFG